MGSPAGGGPRDPRRAPQPLREPLGLLPPPLSASTLLLLPFSVGAFAMRPPAPLRARSLPSRGSGVGGQGWGRTRAPCAAAVAASEVRPRRRSQPRVTVREAGGPPALRPWAGPGVFPKCPLAISDLSLVLCPSGTVRSPAKAQPRARGHLRACHRGSPCCSCSTDTCPLLSLRLHALSSSLILFPSWPLPPCPSPLHHMLSDSLACTPAPLPAVKPHPSVIHCSDFPGPLLLSFSPAALSSHPPLQGAGRVSPDKAPRPLAARSGGSS